MTYVTDVAGNLITTLNSKLTLPYQSIAFGETCWTCHVQRLYLTEGTYHVSLVAKNQLKVTDTRDACLEFEIEGSAFERLAKNPLRRFGYMLPPHEWLIRQNMPSRRIAINA